MSTIDRLRDADQRRRQAMIDVDTAALDTLLAEELIWTHSSGKTDGKRSFIERIASKAVAYLAIDVVDDTVWRHGDIMIHHGEIAGRVEAGGNERALRNRFLSVWQWRDGRFQLLAWQSTGA
jgi:ketosteroid isomerase-like protein